MMGLMIVWFLGQDSMYAAHLLKYKYIMNPLTVTFSPIQYTEWDGKI